MREKIRVILLANAGILLEGTGARLLIDGLYDPAGTEFQAVPEPVKARLLAGEPPVDLLAFTHLHPDHFSRRETDTYLARNRVRGVLLPEDGGPLAGPVRRMTGVRGTWELLPGVRITWVSSGHIGPQYAETAHFCLLAELSGVGVLVTGDADPERGEPTWQELGWARPDAVLVNPLFYQSPRGRALLREVLRPEWVVLYHIPGADRDPWGLRRMVRRKLERSRDEPYHLSALWGPLDRMTVTGRGE